MTLLCHCEEASSRRGNLIPQAPLPNNNPDCHAPLRYAHNDNKFEIKKASQSRSFLTLYISIFLSFYLYSVSPPPANDPSPYQSPYTNPPPSSQSLVSLLALPN